ncbi:MAG: DDE-type integrase/transposase/recombinase [Chloroflexi bacterium]|nr:DDE-type integrase/transposase/recombinase [Chloroflexota bacterium]
MKRDAIWEYVAVMRERYRQASHKGKGALLDEMEQVTKYQRKSLLRLLRRDDAKPPRRRSGRPKTYGSDLVPVLSQLWELSDRLAARRLQPFLPTLVEALERHQELKLEPALRAQLLRLSPATLDRLLAPLRRRQPGGPRRRPGSRNGIAQLVPVRTFADWDDARPGMTEADLVVHCGVSTRGFFLTTLCLVDISTAWVEPQAVWGSTQDRVQAGVERARRLLPIPLLGLDTDNGGEFLNQVLYRYCQRTQVHFTRSRPYKKNDQAHVEQKNGAIIRHWVGYDRYQTKLAYATLQEVYRLLRLSVNFFQPVVKLIGKERVGNRVRKRYDTAQTPYQRLLAAGVLTADVVAKLRWEYESLNPVRLRRQLDEALARLWATAEPADGEAAPAPPEAGVAG